MGGQIRPPGAPVLSMKRDATPVPVRDLGELLNAAQIAERCYYGKCTARWAREEMLRLLPDKVVKVAGVKCWYELDVRHAIAASRGAA